MSEVRINILDADHSITGTIHGSEGDSLIAALSAEPTTIHELEDALGRFVKPDKKRPPFEFFIAGVNDEPWDAGIIYIDMAACVVAAESTYSTPKHKSYVQYRNGVKATRVQLPYRVAEDWLFLDSIAEYEAVRDQRRAERKTAPRFDARPILYGAVVEFIVKQCLAARDSKAIDPIAEIHAAWLMTPREDLGGLSPREVILMKREFIDIDLQSREMQWGFLNKPAPCLSSASIAYRFAGFGTHEAVMYYELLRHLLSECWIHVNENQSILNMDEAARLEKIKTIWLELPQEDYGGRSPGYILECERKRLPLIATAEEGVFDDDCPICRMMREEQSPLFIHLDGCNMDDDFPFSFCRTQDEWEEEHRLMDEFSREWERNHSVGNDAVIQ